MRTSRKFFGLLLLCLPMLAVAQPADVIGWQDIPWGSTTATWQAKLGDQLEKSSEPYTHTPNGLVERYTISPYTIANARFLVGLDESPDSGGLASVHLVSEPMQDDITTDDTLFVQLQEFLVQKYGSAANAQNQSSERMKSRKAQWVFPTTQIELRWTVFIRDGTPSQGSVQLHYTPTNNPDLEKL